MEDRAHLVLAECGGNAGSSQRLIWELAIRLPRTRFSVRAWLPAAPGMNEFAAELDGRGVAVERIPAARSPWDWRSLAAIWLRLRRLRPALLHVHHAGGAFDALAGILSGAAGGPRLVVTEHAADGPPAPVRRRILHRADVVAAACGAAADRLVREHGLDRARVRVVPNGVDPPDEDAERRAARQVRQRLGTGALTPLWVCPARLEPGRGHGVLLEALAEVRRRGLAFSAALAGDGPLRGALERDVEERGLRPCVHFVGGDEDPGPLLRAADAVVFPSLREALPGALLEAQVRGRPVVASAVGGVPEVVEDGVSGQLVPAGDARSLATVLEAFHRRPDRALAMGEAAARRARERFSWSRTVDSFEAIYDEVLGFASFAPAGGEGGRR